MSALTRNESSKDVVSIDRKQHPAAGSPIWVRPENFVQRSDMIGWMPCIRRGSTRWWLPRTSIASETVTQVLLETAAPTTSSSFNRWVAESIISDPALFLFCSLQIQTPSCDAEALATWLIQNAPGQFASGDAFLGSPTWTIEIDAHFNQLTERYHQISRLAWIENAPSWLEVTGERVPTSWQQQWPTFAEKSNGSIVRSDLATTSRDPLQKLARSMQSLKSLERSFDTALRKSKLGALKQLAYGLSHEINNPLANILNRAQQLQRGEDDSARVATLQRIVDQVYRSHEMIADLMFYANPPSLNRQSCDLVPILAEAVESFSEEAQRQSIRIESSLPEKCVLRDADGAMLGEMILVLIRNAIEAIGCQGMVVVSLVEESRRVEIHIADSGSGLSDEAREHAFDPYFSGREAGRGLGLGLCRAYRIARLHHGEISLAGGPAGCVATIILPPGTADHSG